MGKIVCENCGAKFSLKKSNFCTNCGTSVKKVAVIKEWQKPPWRNKYYVPVKSGKWRVVISEEGPKEFHMSLVDKNGADYFKLKQGSIKTMLESLKYPKSLEQRAIGNREYLSLKKPTVALNTIYIKTWFEILRNFIVRSRKVGADDRMKPLLSCGLEKEDPRLFDSSDEIDTFKKYEVAKVIVDMFETIMGRFIFIMMFVGLMEFDGRNIKDKVIPISALMEWLEKRKVVIPIHKNFNDLSEKYKQYTFILNLMILGGYIPLRIKGQDKTIFLSPVPFETMYYWLKSCMSYLAGAHLFREDDSSIAHLSFLELCEDISELNAEFVKKYEHLVRL